MSTIGVCKCLPFMLFFFYVVVYFMFNEIHMLLGFGDLKSENVRWVM